MTRPSQANVLLSIQRALLGVDVPALSAVGLRSRGDYWVILIVGHDEFDAAERDAVTTALAEVMADFDVGTITDEFVSVRAGDPLPVVDAWAYTRY